MVSEARVIATRKRGCRRLAEQAHVARFFAMLRAEAFCVAGKFILLGLLLHGPLHSAAGPAGAAVKHPTGGRIHLCVFVPMTTRTQKDVSLVRAAVKSWADEAVQRAAGARVLFAAVHGANGTDLQPHVIQVPGDVDTDYNHLPIRVLKLWHHLGTHRRDECDWYMKADPDTYIHLQAVGERLACFDSSEHLFLGVTHAAVPPPPLRVQWPAVYFGHGGSGYLISRGLIHLVGTVSPQCLDWAMRTTGGSAMEDVVFAMCLRRQGIEVKNYGFFAPGSHYLAHDEVAQELIVNYHQARDSLINSSDGSPFQRKLFWDAQPPPLHGCLLMAHPVEWPEDLPLIHNVVSRGPRNRPGDGPLRCVPGPMELARQAQVRTLAPGAVTRIFWEGPQLEDLDRCFQRTLVAPQRCEWAPLTQQCYGLAHYTPAASAAACAAACCRSGGHCLLFQYRAEDGCWLGEPGLTWENGCRAVVADSDGDGWDGGVKLL